jgi:hypothetical protein
MLSRIRLYHKVLVLHSTSRVLSELMFIFQWIDLKKQLTTVVRASPFDHNVPV